MEPENEARLTKIRRISGILRAICKLFFVPPVVATAWMLWAMATDWGEHYQHFGLRSVGLDNYSFSIHNLSMGNRIVVGGYFTLRWAAMFLVVYYLHRLLGNYSRGEIFSGDSGRQIRRWGMACVLWGAMKFLWVFVPGAVLPHPVPIATNGHTNTYSRDVKVQPDTQVWWFNGMPVQMHGGDLMINGLIIVAISWFVAMAVEMREENELTV
jgi:hypothetical protein